MATKYKELFSSVYSKIKDYDLAEMLESEADDILHDYIRPAILKFEDCSQDLSDRDEETAQFNVDLTDINFEILSNFMVIEYLDATFIRNTMMLKAYMSTTDFHKYDNNNVLAKAVEVRDMYKRENKQLMINYSIRDKDSEFNKLYAENGAYNPSKYSRIVKKGHCCFKRRWR